MANEKTSVLVVDDHRIVFSGIQLIFSSNKLDFLTQNCRNGDECIEILRKTKYDLIILDVNLPDTDTYSLMDLILKINPEQKILIFSMSSEEMYAKRFLKLGALGFVSKQASNDEFVLAVKKVLNGELYLSKNVTKMLTTDALFPKNNNVFDKLSAREFEIMSYFLQGHGSKEISNFTNLHSSTIGTYKFKIFEKLNIKSIIELRELAAVYDIK
jgi:DNA-binding NarL/FixJ family response regulator